MLQEMMILTVIMRVVLRWSLSSGSFDRWLCVKQWNLFMNGSFCASLPEVTPRTNHPLAQAAAANISRI